MHSLWITFRNSLYEPSGISPNWYMWTRNAAQYIAHYRSNELLCLFVHSDNDESSTGWMSAMMVVKSSVHCLSPFTWNSPPEPSSGICIFIDVLAIGQCSCSRLKLMSTFQFTSGITHNPSPFSASSAISSHFRTRSLSRASRSFVCLCLSTTCYPSVFLLRCWPLSRLATICTSCCTVSLPMIGLALLDVLVFGAVLLISWSCSSSLPFVGVI